MNAQSTANAALVLMFVYIDTASAVKNLAPGGKTSSSVSTLKENESLKYVSIDCASGCGIKSPHFPIGFVMLATSEHIDLVGSRHFLSSSCVHLVHKIEIVEWVLRINPYVVA